MFPKLATILIALLITISSSWAVKSVSDFTLKDLDGVSVTLSEELKKGPVLLDFWATWCSSCLDELPEIDRLRATYAPNGLQVFAISVDNPRSRMKVKPFVHGYGLEFRVLLDPDLEIRKRFGGTTTPYTVLIATDGTVAFEHIGYLPGDEIPLEKAVVKLMNEFEGEAATPSEGDSE